jgi:hypothetical protein
VVFNRNGRQIKDFWDAWEKACKAAGADDMIPHDLRRTTVRNLEPAGVSRSVAMQLTGHKTEAVYRRHAIVSEGDRRRRRKARRLVVWDKKWDKKAKRTDRPVSANVLTCHTRATYHGRRSGETGRRAGLKIRWGLPPVRVRFPPPAISTHSSHTRAAEGPVLITAEETSSRSRAPENIHPRR